MKWCEHVIFYYTSWKIFPDYKGNKAEYFYVRRDWKFCPICGAKHPEESPKKGMDELNPRRPRLKSGQQLKRKYAEELCRLMNWPEPFYIQNTTLTQNQMLDLIDALNTRPPPVSKEEIEALIYKIYHPTLNGQKLAKEAAEVIYERIKG